MRRQEAASTNRNVRAWTAMVVPVPRVSIAAVRHRGDDRTQDERLGTRKNFATTGGKSRAASATCARRARPAGVSGWAQTLPITVEQRTAERWRNV
jgi:hypothetical protein